MLAAGMRSSSFRLDPLEEELSALPPAPLRVANLAAARSPSGPTLEDIAEAAEDAALADVLGDQPAASAQPPHRDPLDPLNALDPMPPPPPAPPPAIAVVALPPSASPMLREVSHGGRVYVLDTSSGLVYCDSAGGVLERVGKWVQVGACPEQCLRQRLNQRAAELRLSMTAARAPSCSRRG
jgi:hypothetical protein